MTECYCKMFEIFPFLAIIVLKAVFIVRYVSIECVQLFVIVWSILSCCESFFIAFLPLKMRPHAIKNCCSTMNLWTFSRLATFRLVIQPVPNANYSSNELLLVLFGFSFFSLIRSKFSHFFSINFLSRITINYGSPIK